MAYVDGFVLSINKNKIKEYKKMAEDAAKLWMKHGALHYFECMGEDLNPKMPIKILTFKEMAKPKKGEIVFFSFIVFKSRKHRDSVNKKVMSELDKDPKNKDMKMPFDVKRMAYGGFQTIVEY